MSTHTSNIKEIIIQEPDDESSESNVKVLDLREVYLKTIWEDYKNNLKQISGSYDPNINIIFYKKTINE